MVHVIKGFNNWCNQ